MPKLKGLKSDNLKTKTSKKVTNALSVPVYSLLGRELGTIQLPKEVFGAVVNKNLLAQALRVYISNQKKYNASTKTRGEVKGTTKKMYRQKGTGRARHGAATAPIFVGGGIVFGPRPRDIRKELPKKMKKAALVSAFSNRVAEGKVVALSGLDKASGKTKEFNQLLQKLNIKSGLILTGGKMDNVGRAVNNIQKIDVMPISLVNVYEVIKHESLLLTKEAVEKLESKRFDKLKESKVTK